MRDVVAPGAKVVAEKAYRTAQRLKALLILAAVAASLKRCPDTNRFFSAVCKALCLEGELCGDV
jgi:hypothetical protein